MTTEIAVATKITQTLLLLRQQRSTGELVITHGKQTTLQWRLYFFLGRLVYATGGPHTVRRWYRAYKYACPTYFNASYLARAQSDEELWEVDLLNQALNSGVMSTAEYKTIIRQILLEVVFTLIGQKCLTTHWHAGKEIPQRTAFLAVEQLLHEAQTLRSEWRSAGLGFLQELLLQFSPDLAPVLKHRLHASTKQSATVDSTLLNLLRGDSTFWDIALATGRSLADVLRGLSPMIRLGVIELKEIADLPSPCPQPLPILPPIVSAKARIAYIDDNPSNGRVVAQLLETKGYEVISIWNPLQGLSKLLECRPDLIFLEPVMANTNGYEFCSLLHKTAAFQKTPIVILTGQDGMLDRVRARFSGASEFLSKPLETAKVLEVVEKYLGTTPPNRASITTASSDCIVA